MKLTDQQRADLKEIIDENLVIEEWDGEEAGKYAAAAITDEGLIKAAEWVTKYGWKSYHRGKADGAKNELYLLNESIWKEHEKRVAAGYGGIGSTLKRYIRNRLERLKRGRPE